MAKSTYLQLCADAISECGMTNAALTSVTGNSSEVQRIIKWVADGDKETQSRWLDWDFLHIGTWTTATVIGAQTVAAPTDLGQWDSDSFYLDYNTATPIKLTPIDYKTWRSTLRNGIKVNSTPSYVVVMPDLSLMLEPPPSAIQTLTADYWKRPAKMAVASDTSPIPEEYERIIIARAKIYYGEFEAAGEVLSSGQVEYDDLLDKLEAKYLSSSGRRLSDAGSMVVSPQ